MASSFCVNKPSGNDGRVNCVSSHSDYHFTRRAKGEEEPDRSADNGREDADATIRKPPPTVSPLACRAGAGAGAGDVERGVGELFHGASAKRRERLARGVKCRVYVVFGVGEGDEGGLELGGGEVDAAL